MTHFTSPTLFREGGGEIPGLPPSVSIPGLVGPLCFAHYLRVYNYLQKEEAHAIVPNCCFFFSPIIHYIKYRYTLSCELLKHIATRYLHSPHMDSSIYIEPNLLYGRYFVLCGCDQLHLLLSDFTLRLHD